MCTDGGMASRPAVFANPARLSPRSPVSERWSPAKVGRQRKNPEILKLELDNADIYDIIVV
tara:strand:- start:1167 stop:1349 length:183 start_codon:yes stop_codon:yes gene_type:complete